jgi:hypothetical protein
VSLLPAEFADLEPYAATWCLATEPERYAARLSTPMPALQQFYDALEPRGAAAIDYCDGFELHAMPEQARNLLHLIYSWINVSFPVEVWGQPRVPDSGSVSFDCFVEPSP